MSNDSRPRLPRLVRLGDRRVFGVRGLGRVLLALGGLLIVLFVVVVIGAIHAVRLDHRLQNLQSTLKTAQNQLESGQLAAAGATLSADQTTLSSINSSLYTSPDFRLLDILPVGRQNLHAVRSSVHLALGVLGAGQQVIRAASPLESSQGHLKLSLRNGQVPIHDLQAIQSALASALPTLPTSVTPPHESFLLGGVRRGEQKVWNEAYKRRRQLTSVNDGLGVLNELTGGRGKRRYLIAVANTAEMRGAGGMILSYGVLNAADGKVSLGRFGNIDQLALKKPAPATFPADFLSHFANQTPNFYWRNATIMSDFTVDAPVLESMYTQATGLPVNGVIQADPVALAAILAGIGPIKDPALGVVTGANVVPLTLNVAYVDFPNRPSRQGYLEGVAREAFAALTGRPVQSLRPLGKAIGAAAASRHILLYSSDPIVEADAKGLGISGALPGPGVDFTQLTVQNFGGDKLDYYLHSALVLTGTRPGGGPPGHLTATIALRNDAPPHGRPRYIFGPYKTTSKDPPGLYRGLVTLYLPAGGGITADRLGGRASHLREGTQNNLTAITYYVTIPAGATSQVTIDVRLPPRPEGPDRFLVVPTPRIYPTVTAVNVAT